jgi:hypothetical protein
VSPDGGFAGTMLFHHPITDRQRYTGVDEAYRTACCNAQDCAKYFMRREINTCQGYVPPAVGMCYVALNKVYYPKRLAVSMVTYNVTMGTNWLLNSILVLLLAGVVASVQHHANSNQYLLISGPSWYKTLCSASTFLAILAIPLI